MRRALTGLALAAALTACGGSDRPAPAPAAVRDALSRVDRLLAAHDYAATRLALEDLVRKASAARSEGDLSAERSDSITAAAARLAAALPRPVVVRPSPTPAPPTGGGEHKRKKHGEDKDHGD